MPDEPFSVREGLREDQQWVFDEVPESVRVGLRWVLEQMGLKTPKEQREILCRALRVRANPYNSREYPDVDMEVNELIEIEPWYEFVDGLERIPTFLDSVIRYRYFSKMDALFAEAGFGYRFEANEIVRRGTQEFRAAVAGARHALSDDKFNDAHRQFEKGLNFRDARPPDWSNAIKEAANSVEATLQIIYNRKGVSMTTILSNDVPSDMPSGIKGLFKGLYGQGSGTVGSRHASVGGATPTAARAELALHVAAALHSYAVSELDSQPETSLDLPFC